MNADLMLSIGSMQSQDNIEALFRTFKAAITEYGFSKFIISGLPDRGLDIRPFVLLSGWEEEWYRRYTEMGYVHLDPVALQSFKTSLPFDWAGPIRDRVRDKATDQLISDAYDFGMREGICIPVHMDNGMQGIVSLAGNPDHLDNAARLEVHLLSLYVLGQLRKLKTGNAEAARRRVITPREAEVLKWVAAGKTASEIAEITGLTARTVNQHCENAQRRMGTSNRLQTVVEAIRYKLITL